MKIFMPPQRVSTHDMCMSACVVCRHITTNGNSKKVNNSSMNMRAKKWRFSNQLASWFFVRFKQFSLANIASLTIYCLRLCNRYWWRVDGCDNKRKLTLNWFSRTACRDKNQSPLNLIKPLIFFSIDYIPMVFPAMWWTILFFINVVTNCERKESSSEFNND